MPALPYNQYAHTVEVEGRWLFVGQGEDAALVARLDERLDGFRET